MTQIPTEVHVTQDAISASVWVKRGNMIVQRNALDITDPDSYWQLWENTFGGVLPEDFQIQLWDKVYFKENDFEVYEKAKKRGINL